ncbi:MAG: hypothetical protein MUC71_09755 [Steroidobacteraceae bacterium]|jgi:hypothetical protein|nr:hypothetical protein [Steroidobacteraceae bacterium]
MSAESPRAALDFFRGEWTIRGLESTYTESCDWLPGHGFVVCHAEDRSETQPSFSMSVFGYSETGEQYTYHGFAGPGTQRTLRGNVHDGIWRFHGQSERGPYWRRWQVTITPTAEGFHFREEVSDRSGPWKSAVEFAYVRKANSGS